MREKSNILKIPLINTDTLYNSICQHFFENFFNISKAIENQNLTDISINEIFSDFGSELNEYYPTLVSKFNFFLDNQVVWLNEIVQSVTHLTPNNKIIEVNLFKGDLHNNNNKSASRILLENGSCYYVKPKTLRAEATFYTLLKTFFRELPMACRE